MRALLLLVLSTSLFGCTEPEDAYRDSVTRAAYNARVKEICDKAGLVTRTNSSGIAGCYDYTYDK